MSTELDIAERAATKIQQAADRMGNTPGHRCLALIIRDEIKQTIAEQLTELKRLQSENRKLQCDLGWEQSDMKKWADKQKYDPDDD